MFNTTSTIAAITAFRSLDIHNVEKKEFKYNEPIKIIVEYDVYDDSIKNGVLGIALYSVSGKYTCGLNTYLDEIIIPWEKGHHQYCLQYPNGLLAISGQYYFDVALEDQTATVPIHYIHCVQKISIASDYVSEGIYTIPHIWGDDN